MSTAAQSTSPTVSEAEEKAMSAVRYMICGVVVVVVCLRHLGGPGGWHWVCLLYYYYNYHTLLGRWKGSSLRKNAHSRTVKVLHTVTWIDRFIHTKSRLAVV